ncbi:MAG: hypothetical protein ACK5LL_12595 [Suipraeoptans sp.]
MIEHFIKYEEKPKTVNYWFEVFWEKRTFLEGSHWCDIETVILDELVKIDNNYYDYYKSLKRCAEIESEITRDTVVQKLLTIETPIIHREVMEHKNQNMQLGGSDGKGEISFKDPGNSWEELIDKQVDCVRPTSKEEFISALFYDLQEVEKEFTKYIEEEMSSNNTYLQNANQLISELMVKEFIECTEYLKMGSELDEYHNKRNEFIKKGKVQTQILSFNYTYGTYDLNFQENVFLSNVHGNTRDGNCVFGIDGHIKGDNTILFPFTKTYRIMEASQRGFEFTKNLKYIKFLGHGLAEADYSYFQTIFDSIDLYNGKTKLIFYHNIYDESQSIRLIENQKKTVYKLIKRYGETLDNKDHGKNMLHKLLIEGRIKVIELDTHFIRDDLEKK